LGANYTAKHAIYSQKAFRKRIRNANKGARNDQIALCNTNKASLQSNKSDRNANIGNSNANIGRQHSNKKAEQMLGFYLIFKYYYLSDNLG